MRTTNIAPIYEDEAFQNKVQHNLQDSVVLLKEAFEKSQLLAIGEPNHTKSTTPRLIAQFLSDLKKINDKSLKYIFVERSQELKEFFEALSEGGENIWDNLSSEAVDSLCWGSPNNSYLILDIAKEVQKINKNRSSEDKLIIVPIDGTSLGYQYIIPEVRKRGDCGVLRLEVPHYILSYDREYDTSQIATEYISQISPNKKALVYFHNMHLIQGLEACLPGSNRNHISSRGLSPLNWLSLWVGEHPEEELDLGIILIDEADEERSQRHTFSLSYTIKTVIPRLFTKSNPSPMGLRLSPLHSFIQDQLGPQVFSSPLINAAYDNTLFGEKSLDQMADYLIWAPGGPQENMAEENASRLPDLCDPRRNNF